MGYANDKAGRLRRARQGAPVPTLTEGPGTADGVIADVGAGYDPAVLNDNFRELAAIVNALISSLRAAGILADPKPAAAAQPGRRHLGTRKRTPRNKTHHPSTKDAAE
jgi:hypothetical protein